MKPAAKSNFGMGKKMTPKSEEKMDKMAMMNTPAGKKAQQADAQFHKKQPFFHGD